MIQGLIDFTVPLSLAPIQYISEGLALHYDALNNTGSGYDPDATIWKDLAGNNDGVLQNAVWTEKSLQFNGNARVMFAGTITPAYTIMSVFKRYDSLGAHPRLNAEIPYPSFYLNSNNAYAYAFYGQGKDTFFVPRKIMPTNEYVHVAFRFSSVIGSPVEFFENGTLVGSISNVTQLPTSVATAFLGGRSDSVRFLNGEICNFMRYSRSLSDEEVHQNYLVDSLKYLN